MLYSNDMQQLAYISRKAGAFVREHDLLTLENGRYDLGDGDYVNVMEYTSKTRSEGSYESHKDYVDIQCVIKGEEYLEVAPTSALCVTKPYDEAGDYMLFDGAYSGEKYLLTPGRFCLVIPDDAHMPGVSPTNIPGPVKKAVFKIQVSHLEPIV
ncbi:MAG: YhcH/YjgK/YiaL family protein [Coriobacteriales bacterium]|nr:YhcH/YjgK/YiaL family protein [Coriobacteriales bacterium]